MPSETTEEEKVLPSESRSGSNQVSANGKSINENYAHQLNPEQSHSSSSMTEQIADQVNQTPNFSYKFESTQNHQIVEANLEEEEDSGEFIHSAQAAQCQVMESFAERQALPAFKDPNKKVSIWKVIKDSIGKDLSKLTVPVYYNEPLSMLQKIAEIMEYQHILVKANKT